jgi:hypothetical protein
MFPNYFLEDDIEKFEQEKELPMANKAESGLRAS